MTFRTAPKDSLVYIAAQAIAQRAAAQYPEKYVGENFEPHEWVIQAVVEAIANSAEYIELITETFDELNNAKTTNG